MLKDLLQPSTPEAEIQALSAGLNGFFIQAGLSRLSTSIGRTRDGAPIILLSTDSQIVRIDPGPGLDQIKAGNTKMLFRLMAKCFPGSEDSVTAMDLMSQSEFQASCLTEISNLPTKGNECLNGLTGALPNEVPVLYGSTSGLNLAEVFETVICAQAAINVGINAYIIFDITGNDNLKARQILANSVVTLPGDMKSEFSDFQDNLGRSPIDRHLSAVSQLVGKFPIIFTTPAEIIDTMGQEFSLAKLALLAKLAGGDPLLFEGIRASALVSQLSLDDLCESIANSRSQPAGFTYYAREAVLGADMAGSVILPFKLTTHANIYKILGRYGALTSQRLDGGAILCPITRQRIQTREQSRMENDPCDVTVIAFLASKFPDGFSKLVDDFAAACQVLDPAQAMSLGTTDNRFIIEDYFPI